MSTGLRESFVFSNTTEIMRLMINYSKIILVAASPDQRQINIGQNFKIGDQYFEVTSEYIYLGSLVNSSNNET